MNILYIMQDFSKHLFVITNYRRFEEIETGAAHIYAPPMVHIILYAPQWYIYILQIPKELQQLLDTVGIYYYNNVTVRGLNIVLPLFKVHNLYRWSYTLINHTKSHQRIDN